MKLSKLKNTLKSNSLTSQEDIELLKELIASGINIGEVSLMRSLNEAKFNSYQRLVSLGPLSKEQYRTFKAFRTECDVELRLAKIAEHM